MAAVVAPLSLVALAIYGPTAGSSTAENLLPFFSFVLLVSLWLLMPWWLAWRQYRKQQTLRERIAYRLTEFGIRADGENSKGEIAWKVIHAVRETRTMFVIYHSAQIGWVIPKRFVSGGAVDAFRTHLESGLRDSDRYHPPGMIASLF
jgi:hypothetical protein